MLRRNSSIMHSLRVLPAIGESIPERSCACVRIAHFSGIQLQLSLTALHAAGMCYVDRVLYSSVVYPHNYGAIRRCGPWAERSDRPRPCAVLPSRVHTLVLLRTTLTHVNFLILSAIAALGSCEYKSRSSPCSCETADSGTRHHEDHCSLMMLP
jgi:hypothetical protein